MAAAARDDLAGCDAKTLFIRAGEGHQQARHLVSQSAQVIARMIADVKATTDCQCVVIGGSVGLAEGYRSRFARFDARACALSRGAERRSLSA